MSRYYLCQRNGLEWWQTQGPCVTYNLHYGGKPMHQPMLYALSRIILGRNGRRISALGDIRTAYTQLFADYYRTNPQLSIQTYYKYSKQAKPYPQSLCVHYAGDRGYHRTLGDLLCLVDNAPCITVLYQIYSEVHQWLATHLPPDTAQLLNRSYVNDKPTRRQIALYLTDVLHFALCDKIHQPEAQASAAGSPGRRCP